MKTVDRFVTNITPANIAPANLVIERFGGVRPLARLLNKNQSTIHRWKMPTEAGGLGGRIPSKAQIEILNLAEKHGILLLPEEIITGGKKQKKGI